MLAPPDGSPAFQEVAQLEKAGRRAGRIHADDPDHAADSDQRRALTHGLRPVESAAAVGNAAAQLYVLQQLSDCDRHHHTTGTGAFTHACTIFTSKDADITGKDTNTADNYADTADKDPTPPTMTPTPLA